jgi:hypothetical protein
VREKRLPFVLDNAIGVIYSRGYCVLLPRRKWFLRERSKRTEIQDHSASFLPTIKFQLFIIFKKQDYKSVLRTGEYKGVLEYTLTVPVLTDYLLLYVY